MQAKKPALLSTTYFGPVQYYAVFLHHPGRIIERHDNYTKQTYRNRCNIYGANGILSLSIPVLKGPDHKSKVKDIRIDYSKNWRKLHWKGIESAYRHSPFFEFLLDEIRSFFEKEYTFLIDINTEIMVRILGDLDMDPEFSFTDDFIDAGRQDLADYRESIHPKVEEGSDPAFRPHPYHQVFSEKHGFLPNLSILDLIFNEGPNARTILEKSLAVFRT